MNLNVSTVVNNSNQGFTNVIYIAPPGDLTTGTTAGVSGYFDGTNVTEGSFVYTNARLINVNLQTHYLFKIKTREADVQAVTQPMNI